MRYRKLGKTGIEVSELSLGAGTFRSPQVVPKEEVHRIVQYSLKQGINYIDTAPAYGYSEEVLGFTFERINTHCILSTKLAFCDF